MSDDQSQTAMTKRAEAGAMVAYRAEECDGTGTDTEEAVCTFCSGSGICHDCQGEEV